MKLFTTVCMLASFLLCFLYMRLFAQVHHSASHLSRSARLLTVQEMAAVAILMIACLIGAAVGAVLIVGRARQMYREEAMQNMRMLLEGAKNDRQSKLDP